MRLSEYVQNGIITERNNKWFRVCPYCNEEQEYSLSTNCITSVRKNKRCSKCHASGPVSIKTRLKMSLAKQGKYIGNNNPNYKGGPKRCNKCNKIIGSHDCRSNTCIKCRDTKGIKNGMYGKTHTPESLKKIFDAQERSKKWKEFVMPDGSVRKCQGYEPYTYSLLLGEGITPDDITTARKDVPKIKYDNHIYIPDVYIKSKNLIVETKSQWTFEKNVEQTLSKMYETLASGYDVRLIIWNKNQHKLLDKLFSNTNKG